LALENEDFVNVPIQNCMRLWFERRDELGDGPLRLFSDVLGIPIAGHLAYRQIRTVCALCLVLGKLGL
jgi:hypothetical protein